ncbi:hypothetical protein ACOI1H_16110 [Loktanella sp. DJP18]|uniref:hypothetical protein n=1 Tax=Loktanella sp. DJP18 TaxID=3409788 RepID=UPI003BB5343B
MGYISDDNCSSYRAEIDTWGVDDDMMTDCGERVGDLEPIGDCTLSPGDPSPVGRSPDGDLAYLLKPDTTYVDLSRAACAFLASLLARNLGLSAIPADTTKVAAENAFLKLLFEAAPPVLYGDSNHGKIQLSAIHDAILTGALDALPDNLRLPADAD